MCCAPFLASDSSKYAYVDGNPTGYADPLGLTATGAALGGRIGGWAGGAIGEIIDPVGGGVPGAAIGSALGSAAGDWISDAIANTSQSRAVPYPERRRGRYTCICRANKDGRSADNCSNNNQEFAMGYGEGATLTEAKRAAEKDAKDKLGAKSTHHVQCRCRAPNGDQIIPTR